MKKLNIFETYEFLARETNNVDFREQNEKAEKEFLARFAKYSKEEVKRLYIDYSMIPSSFSWTDRLLKQNGEYVYESVGDTFPLEETMEKLRIKYKMNVDQFVKIEQFHKIYVYILVANLNNNIYLIINEMEQLGYFVGFKSTEINILGMPFVKLQFEPKEQEDITSLVVSRTDTLYHWTPKYNYLNIIKEGLKPRHNNTVFFYPPRVYLLDSNTPNEDIDNLGWALCNANKNPLNNGDYLLLQVNIKDIPEDVKFYYDPNSEYGFFTKSRISNDRVRAIKTQNFKK